MREYSATVGATDGNIIAAIITTQTPRNQPSAPRPVHGPSSMPCIWRAVHHQPTPARANRTATSPSRTRTAANAGARPRSGVGCACAGALIGSPGPGELRGGDAGPALVPDAEGIDPRAPRLGHRQVRRDGVEGVVEPDRLTVLLAERHDVLDLEVDGVADANAVPQPLVADLDRRPFDADDLPHEWGERGHRAAELPTEDLDQLVELLVRRLVVDEHAEPPVAVGHDLRGVDDRDHPATPDVGAVDLALTDVEGERRPAVVVGGAVVEREVARAHQLARARLGVAALEVPCHGRFPPRGGKSPTPGRDRSTVSPAVQHWATRRRSPTPPPSLAHLAGPGSQPRVDRLGLQRDEHAAARPPDPAGPTALADASDQAAASPCLRSPLGSLPASGMPDSHRAKPSGSRRSSSSRVCWRRTTIASRVRASSGPLRAVVVLTHSRPRSPVDSEDTGGSGDAG